MDSCDRLLARLIDLMPEPKDAEEMVDQITALARLMAWRLGNNINEDKIEPICEGLMGQISTSAKTIRTTMERAH